MISNSRDANGRTLSSKSTKEIPKHNDLIDYNFAVAGHAGTMCDADGELFIKPCTQAEVDFYEEVRAFRPEFEAIIPLYLGTLDLNENPTEAHVHAKIPGIVENADIKPAKKDEIRAHLHLENRDEIYPPPPPVDTTKVEKKASEPPKAAEPAGKEEWKPKEGKTRKINTDRAVVLENASFGYKHPNILDAKLGHMRLWANEAPQAKKDKFDSIVQTSTHKNHGFRVAGMQTWKGLIDPNDRTDPHEMDANGYRKYSKDWGRLTVNDQNIMQKLRQFIFSEDAGIDEELGREVARRFAKELKKIEEVIKNNPAHIYSSSLLFVYEGDGQALRAAIKEEAELKAKSAAESPAKRVAHENTNSSNRIDSGIGMDEVENGEDYADPSDEDYEEDLEPLIFSVKLIDFAHAEFDFRKPEDQPAKLDKYEPDDNVLFGVRGLMKLFTDMSGSEKEAL